jgi:hypothetical protein
MTEELDEEEKEFWEQQHLCNAFLPEYKWNMEQSKKIDKATEEVAAGKWPREVTKYERGGFQASRELKKAADAAIATLKRMVEETQRCRARELKARRKYSDYTEGLAKKAEAEVAALTAELKRLAGTHQIQK